MYLARVVLDAEAVVRQAVIREELGILALATLKVLVPGADGVQLVQEGLVGDRPRPQALLVQHGQDAVLVLQTAKWAAFNTHKAHCSSPLVSGCSLEELNWLLGSRESDLHSQ